VRRGAAWPPVDRPSGCLPVQQAVSRVGRWPHCRAVMVAERPRAAHSYTVRRPSDVVAPGCPMPTVPCSPVHTSSVSVRVSSVDPASVRRPVRVQRPPVRCPRVWCPTPRCPMSRAPFPTSGVWCPVRASEIRACRVRVGSVRTGEFVERDGAVGRHTPRDRPARHLIPPCSRPARRRPSRIWCLELACATLAAAASAGPGHRRGGTWAVARLDRLADRETPVARRIARMQVSRCAEVRPLRQAAVGRQERAAGVRPAMT
jgi:hypothetical protein